MKDRALCIVATLLIYSALVVLILIEAFRKSIYLRSL
jgi:hypothetical protein